MHSDAQMLEDAGRVWLRDMLDQADLASLDGGCRIGNGPGGRLEWNDRLREAVGGGLTRRAQDFLPGAFAVRLTFFNKAPDVNWGVPWHQDRVIAVKERHDVDGFSAWSRKGGLWHVEPPIGFLETMLFACVHLDDADEEAGALELALGTHKRGKVSARNAQSVAEEVSRELCAAKRGDVLLVKALTVHRSRPSERNAPRRMLRVDYCARPLPEPLEWALV